MYIPELILEHVDEIRETDVDANDVAFDRIL